MRERRVELLRTSERLTQPHTRAYRSRPHDSSMPDCEEFADEPATPSAASTGAPSMIADRLPADRRFGGSGGGLLTRCGSGGLGGGGGLLSRSTLSVLCDVRMAEREADACSACSRLSRSLRRGFGG